MRGDDRPSSAVLAVALRLIWALTFIAQRTALREAGPLGSPPRARRWRAPLAPALRVWAHGGWRIAAVLRSRRRRLRWAAARRPRRDRRRSSAAIVPRSPCWWRSARTCCWASGSRPVRAAARLLGFAGVAVASAHELFGGLGRSGRGAVRQRVRWAAGTLLTRATPEQPVLGAGRRPARAGGARCCSAFAATTEPFPAPAASSPAMVLYAGVFGAAGGRRCSRSCCAAARPGRLGVAVQRADRRRRARRRPARRAAARAARGRARARQRRGAAGDAAGASVIRDSG